MLASYHIQETFTLRERSAGLLGRNGLLLLQESQETFE